MSKQHENCANYANFVLFLCHYFRRAAGNADAADGGMGISHGLKTVHRTVFLTAFRFPYGSPKKALAFASAFFGDPYGNRTHVTAVKGRCLNRLTNGPGSGNLT